MAVGVATTVFGHDPSLNKLVAYSVMFRSVCQEKEAHDAAHHLAVIFSVFMPALESRDVLSRCIDMPSISIRKFGFSLKNQKKFVALLQCLAIFKSFLIKVYICLPEAVFRWATKL